MSYISDLNPGPQGSTHNHLGCGTAQFEISWPQRSTAIVSVRGELDASNSDQFIDFVLTHSAHTDRLVIDLSGLTFFAIAGLNALDTMSGYCAGNGIRWAVVSTPAVDRLLRICDPGAALPICVDAADALKTVHTEPPSRLLQLVPESS